MHNNTPLMMSVIRFKHDTDPPPPTKSTEQQQSRWLTLEFLGHYLMIAQATYFGFRCILSMSSADHPSYPKYSSLLTNGWIAGRMMDLSDPQYASFRKNLPSLTILMALYLAVSGLVRRLGNDIGVRCLLGLVFLFILHGFNAVKLLSIAFINYLIARSKVCAPSAKPILIWCWAVVVLLATEWLEFPFFPKALFVGVYRRWNVVFKLTVLRMISFSMDLHWFTQDNYGESKTQHLLSCKSCSSDSSIDKCEKFKNQFGCADLADFDWPQYLTFLFYPPLYLAGPIVTFNSFISQLGGTPRHNAWNVLCYACRFVGCFLLLDILLHYCHVVAIKTAKAFVGFSAVHYAMLGFFNLKVIWLKLLVIWRYFRLVALLDGVVSPENMLRCMSNNYSGMAFWRSWHRSFYLWIVRYLYVPLGGSRQIIWNMWPVFMFVAIWHDLSLRLLAWSWLVCLFFLPEILVQFASKQLAMSQWPSYRVWSGVAATASICMMMLANLVGFCVGVEGVGELVRRRRWWWSIASTRDAMFVLNALLTLYSASQIMFEVRAQERRKGIFNNY